MLQIRKYQEDLYILEDDRVRQFLLLGPDKALLLDTGFPDSETLPAVRSLTDKPVQVLLTHGDPDHAGGLGDFAEAWLHEKDWPLVHAHLTLHPLREGDVFTGGEFRLEVLEIPGHTYGSVAFWDRARGLLFSGDSVQKKGPIYLFGGHRNVPLYVESERKLAGMADQLVKVFPCHHDCPITPDYIEKNLQDARALLAGTLPHTPTPGMPCDTYQGQWTAFYCTEEDLLNSKRGTGTHGGACTPITP